MIAKILFTLAVIVVVIVVFRAIGSISGGKSADKESEPRALEHKRPKADDLEWDEASKSYRPRRDHDPDRS